MKVYYSLEELPVFKNAVLTIGAYDGVHGGHRMILRQLMRTASSMNGTSVVLTFFPHPRKVVFPRDGSLQLITTLEEKISLLEECGIEHLIVAPFTVEFSQINPYDYVEKVIIEKINPVHLIIGYDHRFGLNREGDINLLRSYEKKGHFSITEIPEHEIDSLKISSTRIRNHLLTGEVEKANKLLSKPFRISGTVIHGKKVAKSLGFPTANILISDPDKIIPRPGTYAATALLQGDTFQGMLYIGRRQTLQVDHDLSIEIHLLHHFDLPFYDEEITVFLHRFIRADENFPSKKELLRHIAFDQTEVKIFFQLHYNPSKHLVTIALLNWNGMDLLKRFLPSVVTHRSSYAKLLLIDNASTDGSVDYVRKHYPDVDIVELKENKGFTGGYNDAIHLIRTNYIVFLNNDVRVTTGWTDSLIRFMDAHPEVAAVQPKIRSQREEDKFEYSGAAGGYLDALCYPYCRGRVFDHVEVDHGQYDDESEIFWTSGAAMMMKTELFIKVGGFDADFFAHQEEIDLCWRLKNLGYASAYVPQSVVYHLGASTLRSEHPRKTYLNLRNNWFMMCKNEVLGRLYWMLPCRLVLDLVFVLKLLLSGQPSNGVAVLKALGNAVFAMKKLPGKREELTFLKKRLSAGSPNKQGRSRLLLPWAAFVMKRYTFEKLHP